MSDADRRRRLLAARLMLVVTPDALGPDWLAALAAALGSGAVDAVQLREKGADGLVLSRAEAVAALCRDHGALFLLNDRVDLVGAAGADGVHVGEHDFPPEVARAALGPDRLVGCSTHDEREVEAAAGRSADYVGLGPCFATSTKALERPPAGPGLVRRCAGRTHLPLFPIGGITPENVGLLVAAGARRVAVGAGVVGRPDPAGAARAVRARLDPLPATE